MCSIVWCQATKMHRKSTWTEPVYGQWQVHGTNVMLLLIFEWELTVAVRSFYLKQKFGIWWGIAVYWNTNVVILPSGFLQLLAIEALYVILQKCFWWYIFSLFVFLW
jgi:hypothetical protein